MAAILEEARIGQGSAGVELWTRRILWSCTFFAALGLAAAAGTMFWARHELSQPEGIVGSQSLMLWRQHTLYYGLKNYPYTVCAYMPIFYILEGALAAVGLPVLLAGRLISFAALLGIFAIVRALVILYTGDRYAAWTALVLAASTCFLGQWGTTGQVDTLAICFALLGFYLYSNWRLRGRVTLWAAGAACLFAFFTKQTMLAAPAAIFLLLAAREKKKAFAFAGGLGLVSALFIAALDSGTSGNFLGNAVFANLNPFNFNKLTQHATFLGTASVALLILAACTISKFYRFDPAIYLACSTALFLVTAAKVGSDTNYQMEFTILLIVCVCIGLHALGFFPLTFARSRHWVTLLQIPILLHCYLNYRITYGNTLGRVAREQQFRAEIAALAPLVAGVQGRMIFTETDAALHLRGRLDVEPLIYTLLVAAKAVDPEPVRRDLSLGAIPIVVLYENVFSGTPDPDPEFPRLPPSQMAEIRGHYRLVQHIPGAYLNGIFVYRPKAL